MIVESAIQKHGVIYRGYRHHTIIHAHPPKFFANVESEQGFVTNTGEFSSREAAALHALACGQIAKLKYSTTQLFSEDLW